MQKLAKANRIFTRLSARSRALTSTIHTLGVVHPHLVLGGKFLVLVTIFFLLSLRRLDPDFGWHLQAGNFIRGHGIPAHDIFTYTARSFPWINHEWGNDTIVSLLFGLGGYTLVAILFGLLWSSALMVVGWRARLLTLVLAAIALLPYSGIRAIAWTALALALTFSVLSASHRRLVWLLPPLFVIWASLHGGFVVGLAVMLYVGLYRHRRDVLVAWPLAVMATFINPYGPRLYVEIARTLFDPALHTQISEWMPLFIEAPLFSFLVLWALGTIAYEHLPLKQWFRPSVIMLLGALSAARNFPLFVVTATTEVDAYIGRLWRAIAGKSDVPTRIMAGCIVCFLGAMAIYGACTSFLPIQNREAAYPVQAVSYLQQHGCSGGNLFNSYDYGGYLIWKLPNMPVYIDGRMPSWRDARGEKYIDRYEAIIQGRVPYRDDFSSYNIRCAVLERGQVDQPLITELSKNSWHQVVSTDSYLVFTAP